VFDTVSIAVHSLRIAFDTVWIAIETLRIASHTLSIGIQKVRIMFETLWIAIQKPTIRFDTLSTAVHELRIVLHTRSIAIDELRIAFHKLRIGCHKLPIAIHRLRIGSDTLSIAIQQLRKVRARRSVEPRAAKRGSSRVVKQSPAHPRALPRTAADGIARSKLNDRGHGGRLGVAARDVQVGDCHVGRLDVVGRDDDAHPSAPEDALDAVLPGKHVTGPHARQRRAGCGHAP
jgi:hypothetical protein